MSLRAGALLKGSNAGPLTLALSRGGERGLGNRVLPCPCGRGRRDRRETAQDSSACLEALSGLPPGGFLEVSSLGGTALSLVPDFINTRVFGDDIRTSTSHARLKS